MKSLARSVLLTGAVASGVVGGVLPAAAAGVPVVKLQAGSTGLFLANIDDDAGVCQAKAKKAVADAVEREAVNDQAFYKKKDELSELPDKDEAERQYQLLVKAHQKDQNLADREMAACNDAADTVVNGVQDEKDLARIKTWPSRGVSKDATGKLTLTNADRVHLFVKRTKGWQLVGPDTRLTASELRHGVELGIEGKDIIRDSPGRRTSSNRRTCRCLVRADSRRG